MVTVNKHDDSVEILLQPNRSATWLHSKRMIAFIFIVVSTIAIGWSIVGVWFILPFAGLEAGLFACLMYVVSKQTYREQSLLIAQSQINIINRLGKKQQRISLSRLHCHADIIESTRDWRLPVVYLATDSQRYEIGEFLNLEDKEQLRELLGSNRIPVCRTHWWKNKN